MHSVLNAITNIDAEIFVVDNASNDGTEAYIKPKFSQVNFISNKENVGFAKANNQALKYCKGKYILFLNPDTILPENCLEKCCNFLQNNPDAGALGIRMIDGNGKFLPESKRSFPSPLTSLYKLIGLNKLFPKSAVFGKYSLGYLDEFQNHKVDVLAGAFIMIRNEIVTKLNGFDESFFMYGEDIDLSYRIQKLGYNNYYFSESSIIHFKGESTKKGSLNYVKMFYQAMSIFVRKHYSGSRGWLFGIFIQLAIFLRASLTVAVKFILKAGLPILDAVIIFGSFEIVEQLWITHVRNGAGFAEQLVSIALPGFAILFLLSATIAGMYDNKYRPFKVLFSTVTASIIMLAAYSLLPEKFRFSRGVILLGGLAASIVITVFRWLLLKSGIVEDTNESKKYQQTLIAGTIDEYAEVVDILSRAGLKERVMGRIAVDSSIEDTLGTIDKLNTLLENTGFKELIFCQGYVSYKRIMDIITKLPPKVNVRFHAAGSSSIIGSDSKNTSGEIVSVEGNYNLAHHYQKRMKRTVDVAVSLGLIVAFPISFIAIGVKSLYNSFSVIAGKKTWVGYSAAHKGLPALRPAILTSAGYAVNSEISLSKDSFYKIDEWYARHYDWTNDLKIIIKHYNSLGGKRGKS